MSAPKTSGIVLWGGRSSRMHRPKALLPWRGRSMLENAVSVLGEVVDEVIGVSAPDLALPPLGARVVHDREPGLGPLAGIREGLEAATSEFAFVTSTDAPFLTAEVVAQLLACGKAVAAESEGFVETLCAVYPCALAPVATDLLDAGRMRPLFLLEAADFLRLPAAELCDPRAVRGLNSPAAYLAAVREVEPDARATLELLGNARCSAGWSAREVPVGTLGEILAGAETGLELCTKQGLAKHYLASLDGREFVRDLELPVGSGETVLLLDALAGG